MRRYSLLLPDIIHEGLRKEAFDRRVSMNSIIVEYLTKRYVLQRAPDNIDPNHFKKVTRDNFPVVHNLDGSLEKSVESGRVEKNSGVNSESKGSIPFD